MNIHYIQSAIQSMMYMHALANWICRFAFYYSMIIDDCLLCYSPDENGETTLDAMIMDG